LQDIKAENDVLQQEKTKLEKELRKLRQKLLDLSNNQATNGSASANATHHKVSSTSTTRHTRSDSSSSVASHTSSMSDVATDHMLSIAQQERAEDELQLQEVKKLQIDIQKLIDVILPMADMAGATVSNKLDIPDTDKENIKSPGMKQVNSHKRARRNTNGDKNANDLNTSSIYQSVQQCIHIIQSLVSSTKSQDAEASALKRQLKSTQRQLEVLQMKLELLEQQHRLHQHDNHDTPNTTFNLDDADTELQG
jgi:hypothetical protein